MNVCSLTEGYYTWTLTSDYQISFGKYLNHYEYGTKHASLALGRMGYVAGEMYVINESPSSKRTILWNLLSGTYSIPISSSKDPSNPLKYMSQVMYPAMSKIWSTFPCFGNMYYTKDDVLLPRSLPSFAYIADLCSNNFFFASLNVLTWNSSSQSVCGDWTSSTCLRRS